MISALFFPRSRWHIIFLLPISGYICYGGWKEPLVESSQRSQNTFSSKVQALQSLSTQAGHYSGRTAAADEVGGHYVVISAAETPHKRFCVRLIMDHDNSNVSLWANSQDCPRDRNEGQLWSFNLTRTSKLFAEAHLGLHSFILFIMIVGECAQALATANQGSNLSKMSPVSQLMLQLLSTSLLILLLRNHWREREKQTGNQVVEAPSLIWHIFEPTFTPAE